MGKGLKIGLLVIGAIVVLLLILFLSLFISGGQTVEDPFTSGIDVVNVPYETPGVVTWRHVGVEGPTALYASPSSQVVTSDAVPLAGYGQRIEPRTEMIDGVQVYTADIPAGPVYVRVYADIAGAKWSEEFLVEASS